MNSSFWGSGEVEEGHMQGLGKRQRGDWLARLKRLSYQMVKRRLDSWPQELYRKATNLRARKGEISVS